MSECSIFCVFAFIYLVFRFQPAAWVEDRGTGFAEALACLCESLKVAATGGGL